MVTLEQVDAARAESTAAKTELRAIRAQAWVTASGMEGPVTLTEIAFQEAAATYWERRAGRLVACWIAQGCKELPAALASALKLMRQMAEVLREPVRGQLPDPDFYQRRCIYTAGALEHYADRFEKEARRGR